MQITEQYRCTQIIRPTCFLKTGKTHPSACKGRGLAACTADCSQLWSWARMKGTWGVSYFIPCLFGWLFYNMDVLKRDFQLETLTKEGTEGRKLLVTNPRKCDAWDRTVIFKKDLLTILERKTPTREHVHPGWWQRAWYFSLCTRLVFFFFNYLLQWADGIVKNTSVQDIKGFCKEILNGWQNKQNWEMLFFL